MASHRDLWRPQVPELPEQCASCPFREDNPKEFAVIVNKLRRKFGMSEVCEFSVYRARIRIHEEVAERGDFACHHTAYTPEMELRERSEHRQCPGASKHYRNES